MNAHTSTDAPSPEMKMHPSISPDLISPQQEANLRKLAAYLLTLPADYPDFEMSDFTGDGSAPQRVTCGTAACAVGHGPAAGFKAKRGEDWGPYSERLFISQSFSEAWQWCFSGLWSRADNTVHGASARISWLLDNGLPKDADEQRWGEKPICYLPVQA